MVSEMGIELLESESGEVLDVLTEAFEEGHPLIPSLGASKKATRAVMKAFLDFFGSSKRSYLYGIRKDGKMACISLSVDSKEEPSVFALLKFIFTLIKVLGWEAAKMLEEIHKGEPKYEGRYLELVVLGTRPADQRQGLGNEMLRFLRRKAEEEGYDGIILVADQDTPAFNLYLREGYSVDKEVKVGQRTLCWMRLEIRDEKKEGKSVRNTFQ